MTDIFWSEYPDNGPRKEVPFLDEAWEIARTVAAVDKQLLSSSAVEAFARLAALARLETARRCAEIAHDVATEHASIAESLERVNVISPFPSTSETAFGIRDRIRREFGITGGAA